MDRDIVAALVKTVELKDQTTAAHTWRVALYTMCYVEAIGVDTESIEPHIQAAVLHDVGKIDVPQNILAKPGPLTPGEYEEIKRHPVLGWERLKRMGETNPIILGLVRSHHERIDGSGYPDRLSGHDIPEPARYFAVIDTFDAMTSLRPYRPTVNPDAVDRAVSELERYRGTHYCPECLTQFRALLDDGRLDWILHYFNDPDYYHEWSVLPDRARLDHARDTVLRQAEITTRRIDISRAAKRGPE